MITIFVGLTTLLAMGMSFIWQGNDWFNVFLKMTFTIQWLFGCVIFVQLMGWLK